MTEVKPMPDAEIAAIKHDIECEGGVCTCVIASNCLLALIVRIEADREEIASLKAEVERLTHHRDEDLPVCGRCHGSGKCGCREMCASRCGRCNGTGRAR